MIKIVSNPKNHKFKETTEKPKRLEQWVQFALAGAAIKGIETIKLTYLSFNEKNHILEIIPTDVKSEIFSFREGKKFYYDMSLSLK